MAEVVEIPVGNFTLFPPCDFEVIYTVTLLETKYQDKVHPDFDYTRDEGKTPDASFVTYEASGGMIRINPINTKLQGRTWSVFFNGNVALNTTV